MTFFRKRRMVRPQRDRNAAQRELCELIDCYLYPSKRGRWGVNTRDWYAWAILRQVEKCQP